MNSTPARAAWRRIADDICDRIASGETPVGAKIPSAQQLAIRHGTSQGTAKQAIRHLVGIGVLQGQQGVGVFVQRPPTEEDARHVPSLEARVAALEAWRDGDTSQGA